VGSAIAFWYHLDRLKLCSVHVSSSVRVCSARIPEVALEVCGVGGQVKERRRYQRMYAGDGGGLTEEGALFRNSVFYTPTPPS
jgi:hypothetical protein